MTFSIRDNFLWTCQSSTGCWSLIYSTIMEQISLLSASPKAEKQSLVSACIQALTRSASLDAAPPTAPQPSRADS